MTVITHNSIEFEQLKLKNKKERLDVNKKQKRINFLHYLLIAILVLFAFVIFYYLFIAPERKKNANINKDIFVRFTAIEKYCYQYVQNKFVDIDELDKCKKVVALADNCSKNPDSCSAQSYYENLKHFGFSLPELYNTK